MTLVRWLSAALLALATVEARIPHRPSPVVANSTITNSTTTSSTATNFGIIAIHSGSRIHLSSVNAAENRFWIGKGTATYCPDIEGLVCPPGNYTVFTSGQGYLGLNVVVPGGQLVYVTPGGALGFTRAHSAASPRGSSFVSFNATVPTEGTGRLAYNGREGFLACPTDEGEGPYQVFANIPAISDNDVPGRLADCIGFAAATFRGLNNTPAAWQYQ